MSGPTSASGRCPACGGDELYHAKLIHELRPLTKSRFVDANMVALDTIVCAGCGRAESFCAADSIQFLRKLSVDGKYAERYRP